MITKDDVLAAFPQAEHFNQDKLQLWVDVANDAITPARLKEPRMLETAKIEFVMHQMTRPPTDLRAAHVRAQLASPHPAVKKPHPWEGTPHGARLIAATKY